MSSVGGPLTIGASPNDPRERQHAAAGSSRFNASVE